MSHESKVHQERTAEANTKRMSTRSYCQLLQWKVFFHTNRAVSVLCGIVSTEIIHHNRSRALILDLRSFIMLCIVMLCCIMCSTSQKHTQRFHWLLLRLARGQSCHCATKEIHGTGSFMKFPQILGLANGISNQIWWHANLIRCHTCSFPCEISIFSNKAPWQSVISESFKYSNNAPTNLFICLSHLEVRIHQNFPVCQDTCRAGEWKSEGSDAQRTPDLFWVDPIQGCGSCPGGNKTHQYEYTWNVNQEKKRKMK